LDETVVDDYSDELDNIMDDENVSTTMNEYNFRKQKQMPNLLEDDEHKEQTLDEKVDRSFTFSNDSSSSMESTKIAPSCQICGKSSKNMSHLYQHYCKIHFMKQLTNLCEKFFSLKTLTCDLCGDQPGGKQELVMHVSIKHAKLNTILINNGHSPLDSLNVEEEPKPKPTNFRIPKTLTEQTPTMESFATQHKPANISPRFPVASQLKPSQMSMSNKQQVWSPAMLMASQAPFSLVNQPSLSQFTSSHIQLMTPQHLYASPQNLASSSLSTRPTHRPGSSALEGTLQQLQATTRPQPMGLWAQSGGKASIPNMQAGTLGTTCQICSKTHTSLAQLWQHYARIHFLAELKQEYSFMVDIANKACTECGSRLSSIDALFIHIGTVHRKVNEIMQKRGLHSLEAPVLRMRKSM